MTRSGRTHYTPLELLLRGRQLISIISRSLYDTIQAGSRLGRQLGPGSVVSLVGTLGSGKTTLVKGIGTSLGVTEEITSPTFTIISTYSGRLHLHHIDLYRIGTPEELVDLGVEELLYGDGVSVIEWGERAESILPPTTLRMTIEIRKDLARSIHICSGEAFDAGTLW